MAHTSRATTAKRAAPATAVKSKATGDGVGDDRWLSLRECADVLDCSYSTVSKWNARGDFCPQAVRLPNGQVRVAYRDLMAWVRKLPRA